MPGTFGGYSDHTSGGMPTWSDFYTGRRRGAYERGAQTGEAIRGLRDIEPDLFGPLSTSSATGAGGLGGNVPNVANIPGIDTSAAQAAAFARAKDQVGLESRGALTGLAGAMAGRGIMGSGVEGRGMSRVVGQGQQQLGDVSREQAIEAARQAQQNAMTNYQGDITQRGQTLQSQAEANRLALERQRTQMQSLQSILSGLSGASGSLYDTPSHQQQRPVEAEGTMSAAGGTPGIIGGGVRYGPLPSRPRY